MSKIESSIYPEGIEHREPRPRIKQTTGGVLLGAAVGYALSEELVGAALGGVVGHALTPSTSLPLQEAIGRALAKQDIQLINFYRLGPYSARVLFNYQGKYWTIESHAKRVSGWTQETLDDWLYGDLVEVQLPEKMRNATDKRKSGTRRGK